MLPSLGADGSESGIITPFESASGLFDIHELIICKIISSVKTLIIVLISINICSDSKLLNGTKAQRYNGSKGNLHLPFSRSPVLPFTSLPAS